MPGRNAHIVGKINVEISFYDAAYNHSLLDELKQTILDKVRVSIESLPEWGDKVIAIDHIDIDLEMHPYGEFSLALETALKESIMHQVSKINTDFARQDAQIMTKNPMEKSLEMLIHYLRFGFFPWNTEGPPDTALLTGYFKSDRQLVADLKNIFSSRQSIERFCYELPLTLLESFLANPAFLTRNVFNQVKNQHEKFILQKKLIEIPMEDIRNELLRAELEMTLVDFWLPNRSFNQNYFMHSLVRNAYNQYNKTALSREIWKYIEKMFNEQLKHFSDSGIPDQSISESDRLLLVEAIKLHRAGQISLSVAKDNAAGFALFESQILDLRLAKTKKKSEFHENNLIRSGHESSNAVEEKYQTRIYLDNAGIVLLHPFILPLFQELKLCNHEQFNGFEERSQGVFILQYLCGLRTDSKPGLSLNKMLCGLEFDDVMYAGFKENEQIKQECENLLISVIRHWQALKKTSVEGLQSGFLQRNGVLEISSNDYKLIVEKKPFDILIEKLPWPISIVKLPWMVKPLWVDW